MLVPIIIELVVFGALVTVSLFVPSNGLSTNSSTTSNGNNSTNSTVYITIFEADRGLMAGMNGSRYKSVGTNWPVVTVEKGQTVVIHLENLANESSEPHGFAIDHYFDSPNGQSGVAGVELYSGQSYTFRFVVSQTGTFRMYCSVFCTIHPFMEYGRLIVNS